MSMARYEGVKLWEMLGGISSLKKVSFESVFKKWQRVQNLEVRGGREFQSWERQLFHSWVTEGTAPHSDGGRGHSEVNGERGSVGV